MKKEFSITFWVTLDKNPSWVDSNSEINFPPFTIKNGIQVYFSKIGKELKIYILHPDLGYRKIKANVEKYLTDKTFIALTNDGTDTKLYINADLVTTINKNELGTNLEIGDYVMVKIEKGDLENLKIDGDINITIQAKIEKIKGNDIVLNFFTYGEIKTFSKEKLVY